MKRVFLSCEPFIVTFLLVSQIALAQVPQTMSYQAVLTDANGAVVADGNYNLGFKLYNTATGGTPMWTETQNAAVKNGIANVILGSVTPLNLPFDRTYWLGVTVGAGAELAPRIQLTASAYSLITKSIVDGVITPAKINAAGASAGQAIMYNGSNVVWAKPDAAALSLPFEGTTSTPNGQFDPSFAFSVTNTGTGHALRALATNTGDLTNYGGYFESHGAKGRGVAGIVSTGADARGVYGLAQGNGVGVYGENNSSGTGVLGKSTNGTGVYGSAGGSGNGVAGSSSGSGAAVKGTSTSSPGVEGFSGSGYGVSGTSTSSYGGFFSSIGNDHLDLALGGNVGRINSDPNLPNSDLILSSNNDVIVRLDNNGGGNGVFRVKNSGGADVVQIDEAGKTTTKVLEITGGSDLSEQFDVDAHEQIQPGMVVSIDPANPGKLVVSTEAYDHKVAGIISGAGGVMPGMLMSQSGSLADGQYPVALTGRVYCLADASHDPIRAGDLLTTSSTPGHAMRVIDAVKARGAILGKAMTALAGGKGLVLVLVSLQ